MYPVHSRPVPKHDGKSQVRALREEYGLERAEPHDAVRRLRHRPQGRSRQHDMQRLSGRQACRRQSLPRLPARQLHFLNESGHVPSLRYGIFPRQRWSVVVPAVHSRPVPKRDGKSQMRALREEFGLERAEPHDAVRCLCQRPLCRPRQHKVHGVRGRKVRTRLRALSERMVSKRHCPYLRPLFPMRCGGNVQERIFELRDVRSRQVWRLVRRRLRRLSRGKISRRSR